MADGGVIIDDAGAQKTHIWFYDQYMENRVQKNLKTTTVKIGSKLTAFLIKYSPPDKLDCGLDAASVSEIVITYKNVEENKLTISNNSGQVAIVSSKDFSGSDVYVGDGNITSIKFTSTTGATQEKAMSNHRHTLILTYA
jgi:hypothetical protein